MDHAQRQSRYEQKRSRLRRRTVRVKHDDLPLQKAVMATPERRYTHRYRLKVPLVFCPVHSPLTTGHHAKSVNISSRGIYFVTSHPVFVGLPVQVLLRMPKRIAGTLPTERVFDGRVTRVERKDVPSGCSGVGVEFFCWETPEKGVQQVRCK